MDEEPILGPAASPTGASLRAVSADAAASGPPGAAQQWSARLILAGRGVDDAQGARRVQRRRPAARRSETPTPRRAGPRGAGAASESSSAATKTRLPRAAQATPAVPRPSKAGRRARAGDGAARREPSSETS